MVLFLVNCNSLKQQPSKKRMQLAKRGSLAQEQLNGQRQLIRGPLGITPYEYIDAIRNLTHCVNRSKGC
jgi:hypothetical protein